MDVAQVGQAYSSVADLYIGLCGTSQQVHADDLALIGRHLAGRSGPVLDVGCGPGHITGYLRSLGVDATGIDIVPEFIAHAHAAHPDGVYRLASMENLDVADHSVAGILAWYSLIHLPPEEMDARFAEFRRAIAPGGRLVVGFFDGDEIAAFDHKVITAYRWPVDALSQRLTRAGFAEVERERRPGDRPHRPLAAIAAVADPSHRFRNGRDGYGGIMDDIVSRCPVCGARVKGSVGRPTPPHEVDEGSGPCPGAGRPSE